MNVELIVKTEKERDRAEQFESLVKRTDKENPKPEDLRELKKFFDEDDSFALFAGNLSGQAITRIIKENYKNAILCESVTRTIEKMRRDFGFDESSLLEKCLIEQILICWLRQNLTEQFYQNVIGESHTLTLGIYWEKRLDGAQKRFTRAVESLAKVRKFLSQANQHDQQAKRARTRAALETVDAIHKER